MRACCSCSSWTWGRRRNGECWPRRNCDIHLKTLATYKADWRAERESNPSDPTARTVERWRGETLPMGLLYERAAVEFWTAVVASSVGEEAIGDTSPGEDESAGFA